MQVVRVQQLTKVKYNKYSPDRIFFFFTRGNHRSLQVRIQARNTAILEQFIKRVFVADNKS